jgi:hypothetical protein
MSVYSRLRRVEINEGDVYKAKNLFGVINEDFDARDFLFIDKIPHEYRVYDPSNPVEPTRDIKKLCERDLTNMVSDYGHDEDLISADDLQPEDNVGSVYCTLYNIYQHLRSSSKREEFIDNLSRVFWFIRPNIYDNRVKFHNVMKLLLRGDHDHVYESVKTLSDKIKTTYNSDASDDGVESDDIRTALDRLRGKSSLTVDELRTSLNTTKFQAYTQYEKSFERGPFTRTTKIFKLKYKESLAEKGFKELLDIAYNKIYKSRYVSHTDSEHYNQVIRETSEKLHRAILELYDEGKASKADLIATSDVMTIDKMVVIKKGGLVEVKMRDYRSDSYLSEFFSIYKDANIDPKYKSPEILKIYNDVVSYLYQKMSENDGGIINDIRNNFYGMFFGEKEHNNKMMPIYIPSDYINLYWSDTGKIQTNNQKRLTIRYEVRRGANLFFYDRSSGTMIPQNTNESFKFDDVKGVLTEGRKEKAREKYPMINDIVFNHYVSTDPSGNHKYLDWMLGTTLSDSKNYQNNDTFDPETFERGTNIALRPDKRPIQYHVDMTNAIDFFHQNQQRFEIKDINSYKSLPILEDTIEIVKQKIKEKEEEKEAKKQRDIIYKDDRWLVVSPKTHTASCYYGAGTKWCVTMKNTDTHWRSYSKNATFFFIIDNTKTQEDPLYKVAYRVIGRRGNIEMWDATDREFSRNSVGKKYKEELPKQMVENIESYHRTKFPELGEGEREEWIAHDEAAQALSNYLSHTGIEDVEDWWYGMAVYLDLDTNDYYCVGQESEVDEAMFEYYDNYDDSDLFEYYDPNGDFLEFDTDSFIDDMVSDDVNYNLSDGELLDRHGTHTEWSDKEEELEDLRHRLTMDDGSEEEELVDEISDLEEEIEEMVDSAREFVRGELTDEWEDCFSDGVVGCLVHNRGWYRNAYEMFKSGTVDLNREDLISSLVEGGGDWDSIGGYGWDSAESDEGQTYYIFQVEY